MSQKKCFVLSYVNPVGSIPTVVAVFEFPPGPPDVEDALYKFLKSDRYPGPKPKMPLKKAAAIMLEQEDFTWSEVDLHPVYWGD